MIYLYYNDHSKKGSSNHDEIVKSHNVICFVLKGVSLSAYWISRSMHTVRRIVLRKGGKYVTIVTYGLFGYTSRYATKHISQVESIFNL